MTSAPLPPVGEIALTVITGRDAIPAASWIASRQYKRDAGAWSVQSCTQSHISDPRAHTGKSAPMCDAWIPVSTEKVAALEAVIKQGRHTLDCAEDANTCTSLGLSMERSPWKKRGDARGE